MFSTKTLIVEHRAFQVARFLFQEDRTKRESKRKQEKGGDEELQEL